MKKTVKKIVRNFENIMMIGIFLPLLLIMAIVGLHGYFFVFEMTLFGKLFLIPVAVMLVLILLFMGVHWFVALEEWAKEEGN